MAEAIETNIQINAVGGDQAAQQIMQVDKGFKTLSTSQSELQTKFAHKFEHVGLRIFAGDMLRTIGLGHELRPILGTMQLGINSVASAFGAAASPILLAVTALGAVIAITSRVMAAQKNHVDAIEKTIEANKKELTSLEDVTSAAKDYVAIGGTLNSTQKDLVASTEKYATAVRTNQVAALKEHMAELEKNRQKIIDHAQTVAAWHQYVADAKVVWDALVGTIKDAMAPFEIITNAFNKMNGSIAEMAKAMSGGEIKSTGKDLDDLNLALEKNDMERKKTIADMNALRAGFNSATDQMNKGTKAIKSQEDEWKKVDAAAIKYWKDWAKAGIEADKQFMEIGKKIASDIAVPMSDAFAQMIVEGKSFTEGMREAFTHMAERIISDIIRMIIEWAALRVIMSVWPGGAAAYQATATAAYPAMAGATYSKMANGGKQAFGGTYTVSEPTMFIAGEAGPEIASFTPLAQMGDRGGGGAGSTTIGSVNINLSVDSIDGTDPETTLNLLSDSIRRETLAGRKFANTVSGVASRFANQAY